MRPTAPRLATLCLALAAACSSSGAQVDAGPSPADAALQVDGPSCNGVALVGGQVIDGTGAAPLAAGVVVVCDGLIAAVGGPETPVPAGAATIDATSMTVLPGLVDAHVHLGDVPAGGGMPDYAGAARRLLAAGVTGARVVGDDPESTLQLRAAIDEGTVPGPFLTTAGPMLTAPGGHPIPLMQLAGYPSEIIDRITRQVGDPDQARLAVDAVADQGVDLVKVMVTDDAGLAPRIDYEVLAAVVAEAEARGLRVAAHTATPADVSDALAAGVRSIEHGVATEIADPALVAAIHDAGASYVPTLTAMGAAEQLFPAAASSAAAAANALAVFESGALVALGTDSQNGMLGLTLGECVATEARAMVDAGFSPAEVIHALTAGGAGLVRRADGSSYLDVAGTLEVGKRGDVLVVEGDPLADVADLAQVHLVLLGGAVVAP